jgi:hypothetical protein
MVSRLRRRLETFFFAPVYATPIALLRIAFGLLSLISAATLLADIGPLLGWLRVDSTGEIGWWQFLPGASTGAVSAMAWVLVATSLLMTLGCFSRASTWAVFLLTLALQRYNPAAFNGGDFIMRGVPLMGLALSPAGVYLSIDAWRKPRSEAKAPLVAPWTLRFIQLHISLGYVLTVLLKLRGDTWLGGSAIWYALSIEELTRFDVPTWLAAPPMGAVLTWTSLALELGIGIGVWFRKARPWVLGAGVMFHLGIALLFEIGFFSFVMIASYLAFLPDRESPRQLLPPSWRSRSGVEDERPGGVLEPNTV